MFLSGAVLTVQSVATPSQGVAGACTLAVIRESDLLSTYCGGQIGAGAKMCIKEILIPLLTFILRRIMQHPVTYT